MPWYPQLLTVLTVLATVSAQCTAYTQDTDMAPDPSMPRFLDNVPNMTQTVGRDALLCCNVDQLKSYKVAWVQVDTQTILTIHKQVITRNPRISLLHDDHKSWHLKIENIQEKDRGFYMCQVNTDPMRYRQGYLDVVVPPDILDRESSGDLTVREGDDVTLQCRARGHPSPNITWRREDGQPLYPPLNDMDSSAEQDKVLGETLTLKKVKRLHMGSYLCIASNNVPPSISKRIELSIQFPPMTWVPHQLEGAYIGQELTIECHTEASPKSINYWTNGNGEMIISDDRYESILVESSYKTYMKLRIKQVSELDFGNYSCIAKNSLGQTDGAIRIYKIEPPPTEPSPSVDDLDLGPDYPENNEVVYGDTNQHTTATHHYHYTNNRGGGRNSKYESSGLNDITSPNAKEDNRDDSGQFQGHHRRQQNHVFSFGHGMSAGIASALPTTRVVGTLVLVLAAVALAVEIPSIGYVNIL